MIGNAANIDIVGKGVNMSFVGVSVSVNSNGLKVCRCLREKRLLNLKHVVHSLFFNRSTGVHF